MENDDINALRDNQLHTRVAYLYHYEELTQADIGEKLGITRARVNKILQECRERGLVQVRINTRLSQCVALENSLERAFGLTQALVTPTPLKEKDLYQAIGREAGEYLSQRLRDGQSLGLGWGRTLRASLDYIQPRRASEVSVVSLHGGLPISGTTNPYDIASAVARRLDAAQCFYIAAPMFVSSQKVRDILMSQELFDLAFQKAARVDMAMVGAGDLTNKATNVVLGALTRSDWKSLLGSGAVGELFGYFLGPDGELVDHPINRRTMSPNWEDMLRIPSIVLAAGGRQKVPALSAILSKGHVHVFITDQITAEEVLKSHDS